MNQAHFFGITATNIIKRRRLFFGVFLMLIGIASTIVAALAQSETTARARAALPGGEMKNYGRPPTVATGALDVELRTAIDTAFGDDLRAASFGTVQIDALQRIADSRDVRVAWIVSDLMRFASSSKLTAMLAATAGSLMGIELHPMNA